jgi:hypothetical protein
MRDIKLDLRKTKTFSHELHEFHETIDDLFVQFVKFVVAFVYLPLFIFHCFILSIIPNTVSAARCHPNRFKFR